MREYLLHPSVRHFETACMIAVFLFHPFGMQLLRAENAHPHGSDSEASVTMDLYSENAGDIRGRLVTPRGDAVPGKTVQLFGGLECIARVNTEPNGYFVFSTPSPGVYHITDGTWIRSVRIWAPGTAPPIAKSEILIVANEPIVAGQVSPLRYWMANPNVMLATAAIAIGVPVLIYRRASD